MTLLVSFFFVFLFANRIFAFIWTINLNRSLWSWHGVRVALRIVVVGVLRFPLHSAVQAMPLTVASRFCPSDMPETVCALTPTEPFVWCLF